MSLLSTTTTGRPERPSTTKRNLWILGAAALFGWAALTVDINLADLLALPAGLVTIFYEMYLKSGPDPAYLEKAVPAMIKRSLPPTPFLCCYRCGVILTKQDNR